MRLVEYMHQLRNTIRELYGIKDEIGMSHIISSIDESLKTEIKYYRELELRFKTRFFRKLVDIDYLEN